MNHGCFSVSESLNSSNIKIVAWSCSQLLCLVACLWLTYLVSQGGWQAPSWTEDQSPVQHFWFHLQMEKIAFGTVWENLDSTFPVFLLKALCVKIY